MARSFRFYEKKRGDRRTGSKILGSAGEALFLGAFCLLGCAGLVLIAVTLVIPEWRANHVFVEHTCVVLDKQVGKREGEKGTLYRPEVRIQYEVDGETHVLWAYDIRGAYSTGEEDKRAILSEFSVGRRYPCWYDPSDPRVAVVVRGYSWWFWPVLSIPVSFLLIAGARLIYTMLHWGKSAEHRAVRGIRTAQRDLLDAADRLTHDFPNVPAPTHITDSPGTTLAFRLPVTSSSAWTLGVWLAACLLWNGVVAVFAWMAVDGLLEGSPDWFLIFVLLPFAVVGIGLIVFFFRQLLLATGIGPTLLEISDQPLYPGRTYELHLSQSGRLKVKSLDVALVCEEEATYRHGTNTRTESHRVYRQPAFRREGFEVGHGAPFAARFPVEIPAVAMHTFRSEHNEIQWKFIVRGEVAGRPDFERSFPVIVYPGGNGKGTP